MEKSPIENVLSVKCPLHPSNPSDVLRISADTASHRACIKCLINGDVPNLEAIDIRSLF